jgi:prepilin-type N-terminal cleavage/methylation domain-containing protein
MEYHSATIEDHAPASRGRGFTLAESLIATTILAIAVIAMMGPISATYQQTRAGEEASVGASLARQLMDEVCGKPFVDPTDWSRTLGPEVDEAGRAAFDNVDDYNGYQDATDNLKAPDGTAVTWTNRGVYRRSVAVEYRSTPAGAAAPKGDFALVTVTVTTPGGQATTARRLVSRYPRGN